MALRAKRIASFSVPSVGLAFLLRVEKGLLRASLTQINAGSLALRQ